MRALALLLPQVSERTRGGDGRLAAHRRALSAGPAFSNPRLIRTESTDGEAMVARGTVQTPR
ncbi:hypothetical protein AB0C27_39315 [Nonomuraea sp. NPDC048882]|uniref:hypothetical protein n=1 Tax=unclassified Nonomuraea TaxID=2593643 RepID=UPI0033C283DF